MRVVIEVPYELVFSSAYPEELAMKLAYAALGKQLNMRQGDGE